MLIDPDFTVFVYTFECNKYPLPSLSLSQLKRFLIPSYATIEVSSPATCGDVFSQWHFDTPVMYRSSLRQPSPFRPLLYCWLLSRLNHQPPLKSITFLDCPLKEPAVANNRKSRIIIRLYPVSTNCFSIHLWGLIVIFGISGQTLLVGLADKIKGQHSCSVVRKHRIPQYRQLHRILGQ